MLRRIGERKPVLADIITFRAYIRSSYQH